MTIGEKIRELREMRGMTQDQLAKAVGYKGRSSINKIEKGESDLPQRKLQAIANVLQIPPAALLSDDQMTGLSVEEQIIIRLFRKLNAKGQEYIFKTLLMAADADDFSSDRPSASPAPAP